MRAMMVGRCFGTAIRAWFLAAGVSTLAAVAEPAAAGELLAGPVVAERLSGNTIKFFSPPQQADVLLFFHPGGRVIGRIPAIPGKQLRQTWSIREDGALCRGLPNRQQPICSRIEDDGDRLRFMSPNGTVQFEAALLPGNQLPQTAPQRAGRKAGGGQPPAVVVENQDGDGDGRISKEEFRGQPQQFARIDADKDGFITAEELAAMRARRGAAGAGPPVGNPGGRARPPSLAERLAALDTNGDGEVERSEWRGEVARFRRLDRNRDGVLDSSDIEGLEKEKHERPLLAEAQNIYQVPDHWLERRTGRTDCSFDGKEYRIKHFRITGYSPNCAFGGTVLFTDVTDREWPMVYEISLTGDLIWEYDIGRGVGNSLDPTDRAKKPPMDPSRLPNGNTMFVVKEYGIFEVDGAGRTVWRHMDNGVTHDADRLPNGNTLFVRGWRSHGEDQFREVDPDGRIVWSWTGVEQYTQPVFLIDSDVRVARAGKSGPDAVAPGYEGWIHPNAVTRLADGTTMLSLRNFHRIVFVDRRGALLRTLSIPFVHDPEIQENGNILATVPPLGVTEYAQDRLIWRMEAKDWKNRFDIDDIWLVRDSNRLPNGNIFITSGKRLMEIEPSGRPVWQLENTKIKASKSTTSQAFFKSQRIGPDGRGYGG